MKTEPFIEIRFNSGLHVRYARLLTPEEYTQLYDNPWSIFKNVEGEEDNNNPSYSYGPSLETK